MTTEAINILTPVGRLLQGHPMQANDKDAEGKPLCVKNGPNAGQPRVEYFFALGLPKKAEANWWETEWGAQIFAAGQAGFPGGQCQSPTFAWKVIDGDSQIPNKAGSKPCDKEGFPGHWILNCSGGFAPKVYTQNGASQIVNPEEIKRGYFVRAYLTVRGNGAVNQPGVYLNPSMVEFIAYGEEIVTGPDGAAVFGGAPAAELPAGASVTPLAPATPIAAPTPGQPAAPGAVPATPTPAAAPVVAPAAAAPSASPQPQAAPAAAPAVAPAGVAVTPAPDFLKPQADLGIKTHTVDGVEYTVEQLKGFKWTDEQIAALG